MTGKSQSKGVFPSLDHIIMINIRNVIIVAPDEKGLLPVFGIPAIRRLVLLALQMRFETIQIVGKVNPLLSVVSDLLAPEALHQVDDSESLEQVVSKLALSRTDPVLMMKANHVVDQFSLRRLRETITGPDLYFIGTKGAPDTDHIYVASPIHLVPVLHALWTSNTSDLKMLELSHQVEGAPRLPSLIDKGEDQPEISEAKLAAALAFQTKERDGFLARHLDRRVSHLISKRLAHTTVTPNQITLFNATIGLIGAFFLSRPGYWPPVIGSLLFLFFAVMDGVDGEVSRLRLQDSQFGYYLDMITDNIVNVAIFVGIAFGLYRHTADEMYLKILLFLVGGFGLCAISVYYNILRRSEEELKQTKITRFMALLTNSDFAYMVVICALVRRLNWFFIATTIGTYLFAGTLWAMNLHEKRRLRIRLRKYQ